MTEGAPERTDEGEAQETQGGGCLRLIGLALRLLLVIVLGVGLGAAAYFGGPAIYRSVYEPVQLNAQRIADLEAALSAQRQDVRRENEDNRRRLSALEEQLTLQTEELSVLQSGIAALEEELKAQAALERDIAALTAQLARLDSRIGQAQSGLEALEAQVAADVVPTEELLRQLQLIRALELLARARLNLFQGNLGLAAEDVTEARDSLAVLQEASAEGEPGDLTPIIERLDLALEEINVSSIVAADDLEIAWKLLLEATAP